LEKIKFNEYSLKFKSKQKCQLYFQMKAYLSQITIITTIKFTKFCFNKLEAYLGSNNNNSIKFIERKGFTWNHHRQLHQNWLNQKMYFFKLEEIVFQVQDF